jgi:hypothetical protein
MRAYVAQLTDSELHQFLPEDALPNADVFSQLMREWSSPKATAVWAVLNDHDAEVVREELSCGRLHDAHGVFLNRAVDVRPILPE